MFLLCLQYCWLLEQTEIDYLSLDVEGPELDILETIPFDTIKINVISLEYSRQQHKLHMLQDFFKRIGNYYQVGILRWNPLFNKTQNDLKGREVIFQRND